VLHVGRLITQIENGQPEARTTLRELSRRSGRAQLVGITGPPGAGKSTLVSAVIQELRSQGRTVGVIAVDPSSPFSGGALLGDRDRMLESASGDREVFIRSVASRGASGGLAAAVNDAVDVLDIMGKDVVIIETVGVGQGELQIAKIAHTVVLVLVPGYGDALQAMKAGITEIADVMVVNKADSAGADQTAKELLSQGFSRADPRAAKPWAVPVLLASALRQEGIVELIAKIDAHYAFIATTGWKGTIERERRHEQFIAIVGDRLRGELFELAGETDDDRRLTDPHGAADDIVQVFLRAPASLIPRPRVENPPPTEKL